jgi:two-component system sensor histidine kinase SenX3
MVAVVAFVIGVRLERRRRMSERAPEVGVNHSNTGSQLESLIDNLPMGVTLHRSDGSLIFENKIAREGTGVRHIDTLVRDAIERLVERSKSDHVGDTQLALNGPPARNFSLSSTRLGSGDVVVFVQDVTAKDRLESMRRDFVANLSHELKTPLGGMAALSDSMVGETDQDVIARLAERVASEAQRMSAVIDDLLDLSRIESRADIHLEPVDMSAVINEAVSLQRLNSEVAGVQMEVDAPKLEPIRADRTQMLSAVSNLIENAIKYSERGSTVSISLANGDAVRIIVTDQGIGISHDDMERIFERFYRVDRARSRATGGTGLGLAIAKHAVENNGGSISVSSEEGRGSTFTITLPRGGAR